MKKLSFFTVVCALLLMASCGDKGQKSDEYQGPTTADSLRQALADQDSLLSLVNDITSDMLTIRQMEDIVTTPGIGTESVSRRQQIHDDMAAIRETLQQRRLRLEELEKKLKNANYNNATLKKTIESLKAQIEEQEATIEDLKEQLAQANIIIAEQSVRIDSLSESNTALNEAKEQAEEANVKLADEMNTCFYVVGTKKELNNSGVIKTGFLRKTKILPGDVDSKFFTKGDKRNLMEINCHSKKAEVMTNQPQSSYNFITEANGDKILVIKDPTEFWKKSNYLVIKID